MAAGEVDRLDMGGLYRREAVESVGYLSNRLLHSYEELDLGVRLRKGGWKLERIGVISADHFGHNKNPYVLLVRRWQTRYINGSGEIFRYSLATPWFSLLSRALREIYLYIAFAAWNFLIFAATLIFAFQSEYLAGALLLGAVVLVSVPLLAFLAKKRSGAAALYAYVSMTLSTLGFIRGLLLSRKFDDTQVRSIVLKPGSSAVNPLASVAHHAE